MAGPVSGKQQQQQQLAAAVITWPAALQVQLGDAGLEPSAAASEPIMHAVSECMLQS